MTTLREAAQQALAALEHEAQRGNDDAYRQERDALRAAIEHAERPRQWQGLTEDEALALGKQYYHSPVSLMYAVEAKLKEKNT